MKPLHQTHHTHTLSGTSLQFIIRVSINADNLCYECMFFNRLIPLFNGIKFCSIRRSVKTEPHSYSIRKWTPLCVREYGPFYFTRANVNYWSLAMCSNITLATIVKIVLTGCRHETTYVFIWELMLQLEMILDHFYVRRWRTLVLHTLTNRDVAFWFLHERMG